MLANLFGIKDSNSSLNGTHDNFDHDHNDHNYNSNSNSNDNNDNNNNSNNNNIDHPRSHRPSDALPPYTSTDNDGTDLTLQAASTGTLSTLYGTDSGPPQPSFKLSDKLQCFRLVILQDGGLRNKQTLFDSALGLAGASPNCPASNVYQKLNKSIYHSLNELAAYMFGYYGILMSESHPITKIHYLPSLPGMPCSILITKMFSLDPSFESSNRSSSTNGDDWRPHPSVKANGSPAYENLSTRFSIGVVIPVGRGISSMEEEVTDNWTDISNLLVTIQEVVTEKLKKTYVSQAHRRNCSYNQHSSSVPKMPKVPSVSNLSSCKKMNFSAYILQTDFDLNQQFHSLVRCILLLVETPRLFVALKESNQALISWASAVAAWLELKDGRFFTADPTSPSSEKVSIKPGLKFLASLFSILLPLRKQILEDPMNRSRNKSVRVVIVTGNPIVSQKLIFILAGLIGYDNYVIRASMEAATDDSSSTDDDTQTSTSDETTRDVTASDYGVSFSPTKVLPISIERKLSNQRSSSDSSTPSISPIGRSGSSLLARGWKVPTKSVPIASSSPTVQGLSNVKAERVSIPLLHKETSYASLQNLSSSYGGGLQPQSALGLSSSWRGAFNFGSFMERWKMNNLASRGGFASTSPPRHDFGSIIDRTPSPATDYDEYPWKGSTPGTPLYKTLSREPSSTFSGGSTPTTSETKFGSYGVGISGPSKLSSFNKLFHSYVAKRKFHVQRTATRLITSKVEQSKVIGNKISAIMNADLNFTYSDRGDISVLSVENEEAAPDDDAAPYKLPPLVGYTEKYLPHFSLMSCIQPGNLETSIFESMSEDVRRMDAGSVSDTYVINLRQREVKLFELRSPAQDEYPQPSMSTNFQRSTPNSKLTNDLQRFKLRPKVSLLFSPFLQGKSRYEQQLSNGSTLSVTTSAVDAFDEKLNLISGLINRFFCTQSKRMHPSGSALYAAEDAKGNCADIDEDTCCDKIRELIRTLLG